MNARTWMLAFLLTATGVPQALAQSTEPPEANAPATPADMMCPDAEVFGSGMIGSICWSCIFPIKLMGVIEFSGGSDANIPDGAADKIICTCTGDTGIPEIGFTLGMWAPSRLVEIVRKPWCSPTLNTTLRQSFRQMGTYRGGEGSSDNQFYNYHWFSYPLMEILELLISSECNAGGFSDFDLMYPSELDPTWAEDELALLTNPEVVVAANPLLQAACPADCAAANFNRALPKMWWCAGCWGNLYPFTGNVPSGGGLPRVSSLLAARAGAALHRRGLAWKTIGNDALCGGSIYPMFPKDQYRMSQLFPLPEASNAPPTPPSATTDDTGNAELDTFTYDQKCCHAIGASTFLWGEWRTIPGVGEDAVHLMFRWTDCCVR